MTSTPGPAWAHTASLGSRPTSSSVASGTRAQTSGQTERHSHSAASSLGAHPIRATKAATGSVAAGRPGVATTKGVEGLEDLVGNGVVVADDPAQLATAIADLLTDAPRAESIGLQGRAAVAERHSWKATLAPLVEAVTGASSGERGPRS